MNISGLSFDALPPIHIPFRYFLTAPLFIIACAIYLLFYGDWMWITRWHPSTILVTHGFTLGFITMIMMGAIIQILPVVGAGGIKHVSIIGKTCHLLLTLGTIALMLALGGVEFTSRQWLHIIALVALTLAFTLYLVSIALTLFNRLSRGETIQGIHLALAALLIVVFLGGALFARRLNINIFPDISTLTNLHLMWGMGWVSLLIISVSFQVIPMFHVAPSFPKKLMKILPVLLFLSLGSVFFIHDSALGLYIAGAVILILHCIFAYSLLRTLQQRKRKIADTTVKFWQLSAISLFLITGYYLLPNEMLPTAIQARSSLLIGAVFIYFFIVSILLGMLLKIMPFLSYSHLQQKCLINFEAMALLPNMHDFINKKQGLILFILHLLTGISLIITILSPSFNPVFASMLLVEFLWLGFLMLKTCRRYFVSNQAIENLLTSSKP
ncbi:MAG: hypothetical protein V5789_09100 [Colwellia sp.]